MMSNSAEESLMALLEAMLTLAANEVTRPKPPLVKPGGYLEDCFLNLTEEEKDEFSCNICYQVLKETRQCMNNHKFCGTCLQVWSTTGQYENRNGCPVCRIQGRYIHNREVDERIGAKKVKCLLESCKWSGLLRYLCSHRHTTYGDSTASESEEPCSSETMPRLIQVSPHIRTRRDRARFTGTGLMALGHSSHSPGYSTLTNLHTIAQARGSPSSLSSASDELITELPWRTYPANNRVSSFRMPDIRAPSNNRITFSHTRHSTDSNNNVDDEASILRSPAPTAGDSPLNAQNNSVSAGGLTPRPPSAPRTPSNIVNARRLPRIANIPPPRAQNSRYHPPGALVVRLNSGARPREGENLGEIRDRLQDSRRRLDNLMIPFSDEVNRDRLERERYRQEQLEEVREMGQRLGQVASELRRLLEHRRHIHNFSDDDDDDDCE